MKFKRFIIVLVLLVCAFSFVGCGEGEPENRTTTPFSNEESIELSIYSYNGKNESFFGVFNLGHSFLGFKNLSDKSVIVGRYNLEPDEEITIGTWCIQDFFGVWYNIECNYIEYYDKYNGRISITTHISPDKLEDVNKYIDNNNTWLPTKNCTNFAIGVWNSAVKKRRTAENSYNLHARKTVDKFKSFCWSWRK